MDNGHHNCNRFSRISIKLINLLNKLRTMVITPLQFFMDNYETNLFAF